MRRDILDSDARFAAFWWGSVILTSLPVFPLHFLIADGFSGVNPGALPELSASDLKDLWSSFAYIYPFVFFFFALPFGLILWIFAHMAFELCRWLLRGAGLGENGATMIGAGLLSLASAATGWGFTTLPFFHTAGLFGLLVGPLMAWVVYRRAWDE